jgi:YesN/AraC family two-component response regulator
VLLPPYLLHKSIYRKGPSSKRIVIDFLLPDEWMDDSLGYTELLSPFHTDEHIYRFSSEQRLRLFQKLNDIMNYSLDPSYSDRPVDQLMIHTKSIELLHELYLLKDQNLYQNDTVSSPVAQKMYSIASYIHQHYEEPLSLQMLAEEFYINPYYLCHSFKQTMQFTLSSYIQMTRIKNAQHKLMTTNDKISDIAASCGFASFSQFNRAFNKQTGTSPREYRKSTFLPGGEN